MHMIFLASASSKTSFLTQYAGFSNLICLITQVLINFTLIFGITLNMIFKQKSDEKMRNLEADRLEFNQHYTLGLLTSCMVLISWALLNFIPRYTNKFFYLPPSEVLDSDYMTFLVLSYICDVVLIVSWLVASIYNNFEIEGLDMDPEDEGEDNDGGLESTDVHEEAGEDS